MDDLDFIKKRAGVPGLRPAEAEAVRLGWRPPRLPPRLPASDRRFSAEMAAASQLPAEGDGEQQQATPFQRHLASGDVVFLRFYSESDLSQVRDPLFSTRLE